ncbi:MAG: hypothetical protein ACXW2C_03880 [Acidimicrobiia bacterium]
MQINPYVAARIHEDQLADAHDRARRSRLAREARARLHPEPSRRRIGLAIARVGLKIAGVHVSPTPA